MAIDLMPGGWLLTGTGQTTDIFLCCIFLSPVFLQDNCAIAAALRLWFSTHLILFQLAPQRGAADAQHARGFVVISMASFQRFNNMAPLHFFQR